MKPKPTPTWPFPRTLRNKTLPPVVKEYKPRQPRKPAPTPTPSGHPAAPF